MFESLKAQIKKIGDKTGLSDPNTRDQVMFAGLFVISIYLIRKYGADLVEA
jgi:hypothetical protein